MSLKLYLRDILDFYARENFKKIETALNEQNALSGFRFFEIQATGPVTFAKFYHGLGYVPQDIVRTRLTGTGILTFDYDQFDSKFLVYSTTAECELRFFVGTYGAGGVNGPQ